jgi:hypothetical protein
MMFNLGVKMFFVLPFAFFSNNSEMALASCFTLIVYKILILWITSYLNLH